MLSRMIPLREVFCGGRPWTTNGRTMWRWYAVDRADVEGCDIVGADEFGVGGGEADCLKFDQHIVTGKQIGRAHV